MVLEFCFTKSESKKISLFDSIYWEPKSIGCHAHVLISCVRQIPFGKVLTRRSSFVSHPWIWCPRMLLFYSDLCYRLRLVVSGEDSQALCAIPGRAPIPSSSVLSLLCPAAAPLAGHWWPITTTCRDSFHSLRMWQRSGNVWLLKFPG